jgi:hypothetical protein
MEPVLCLAVTHILVNSFQRTLLHWHGNVHENTQMVVLRQDHQRALWLRVGMRLKTNMCHSSTSTAF